MSEQEKWQKIYDLLNAETKLKKISEIIGVSLWFSSSPHLNPLDYAIWSILENKTNVISHPNIGSLKTITGEEWNKMSEEFILKVCWYNNWKKWWPYWVNLLFVFILFFKIKINLVL